MHVKSVAGANVHAGLQYAGGAGEILGPGDFQVIGAALGDSNGQARGAGDFDIICRLAGVGGVCRADRGKVKALRRLRGEKGAAVLRAGDAAVYALPKGVGDRQSGGGGLVVIERFNNPKDNLSRDAGPRGVMDQHLLRLPNGLKPALDRGRTLRPAGGDGNALGRKCLGLIHVVFVQHQHDFGDLG